MLLCNTKGLVIAASIGAPWLGLKAMAGGVVDILFQQHSAGDPCRLGIGVEQAPWRGALNLTTQQRLSLALAAAMASAEDARLLDLKREMMLAGRSLGW